MNTPNGVEWLASASPGLIILLLAVVLLVSIAGYVFFKELPAVRRYFKMKRM